MSVKNRALPEPAGRRLALLVTGLVLFGVSLAMLVEADLGLDPWDVFHQGVADTFGAPLGVVVVVASLIVLLAWIPLRQRPGIGTALNAVVVGVVIEVTLAVVPPITDDRVRWVTMLAAVAVNGIATGMYIGAGLGPGPRDGLMTGLARRRSVRTVRTSIEAVVLIVGWLLGGTVGVATVVYAVAIGPIVHVTWPRCTIRPTVHRPTQPTTEEVRPCISS